MTRGPIRPPAVAVIDEAACIGCTLCIEACPVDAIVGATRLMHTVIASECIGCKLCLPPCPVDCIAMAETGLALSREEKSRAARHARARFKARNQRLASQHATSAARLAAGQSVNSENAKRATITRAMERARVRLRNKIA